MVHVPFFNIDLPEPRLGSLIPNTVGAAVRLTAKSLEYGHDLLYPPSKDDVAAINEEYLKGVPREFDRVRKRYAEGKILNDEQLSSELEDASFDWYRRQLRTSVLGATEEEMEDVAARKLGLTRPSLQDAVQGHHLAQALEAAGGLDLDEELRDAVALKVAQERQLEFSNLLMARKQRIAELRRQVRPPSRQAVSALTNASGGMLLGVLLFKSALLVARGILGKRKPRQRPPARTPPQRPATPAPLQQQQLPQPQRPQLPQRPQQASTAPPQAGARQQAAAAAAAAQKQPQDKGQASQAGDAGSARKTRMVKKR